MIKPISKIHVIAVRLVCLSLLIAGCGKSDNNNAEPTIRPTDSLPVIYKVTKSTYLYDAPQIDAKNIAELPVGTLVKPANDEKYYDCESFVDSGTSYILCFVEVINTKQSGWVLQRWIEKNN